MNSSKTWTATGRNASSHRRSVIFMLAVGAWRRMRARHERSRQRHQLTSLNDHQLQDIGLQRWDIELEAKKPFWRA
jgi:uncharacterized protein YjiS (DUF1127 family)